MFNDILPYSLLGTFDLAASAVIHCMTTMPVWQHKIMYLCMGKWKYVFILVCWLPTTPHKDIAQREASSSTHRDTQTKDRERERERGGWRVAEVCKDILYERVAAGGQHNLPRQLIYRLSCQVLIVIVRRAYLHTCMCKYYCRQLLPSPRLPNTRQPSEVIKLALQIS